MSDQFDIATATVILGNAVLKIQRFLQDDSNYQDHPTPHESLNEAVEMIEVIRCLLFGLSVPTVVNDEAVQALINRFESQDDPDEIVDNCDQF
jgi:hypothetical protein